MNILQNKYTTKGIQHRRNILQTNHRQITITDSHNKTQNEYEYKCIECIKCIK